MKCVREVMKLGGKDVSILVCIRSIKAQQCIHQLVFTDLVILDAAYDFHGVSSL